MEINKNNIKFNVLETQTVGNDNFWCKLQDNKWEPNTFKIFSRFLNRNYNYVDVGAWIGPTVLYGSQLAKTCYAIEPDSVAFNILNKNIKLNNIKNIKTYLTAINNKNGVCTLGNKNLQGNSMSSLLFNTEISWKLEGFTLETFFKLNNIINCNFIKMDIEGGESIVLPQAMPFLKSFNHILYMSVHTPFFKTASDYKVFAESLGEIYPYLYLGNGNEITIDSIKAQNVFYTIIASKTKLNIFW